MQPPAESPDAKLHQLFARVIAALENSPGFDRAELAVVGDLERLWTLERERLRRYAKLATLLPTIAESLDVRTVFASMSKIIQDVIPHDVMVFALLTEDRGGVKAQASTAMGVMDLPEYRFSSPEEALDANWRFLLAYDMAPVDEESIRSRISPKSASEVVEVVTKPGAQWMKFLTRAQVRSVLRVPIRAQDRPIGGVAFMSR